MYLPTSTETIRNEVPKYVHHMVSQLNIFPTKTMIYNFIYEKQVREPYAFGKSKIESTQGTLRSWVSDVCSGKIDRSLNTINSFRDNGVDYFYTDINDVFKLALSCSGSQGSESKNEKLRIHCDIQYQLVKIFLDGGYSVWVSSTDLRGQKNMTKYGKTISESFGDKLLKLEPNHPCYWIDVVIFDEKMKPIYLFEIEESTQVLKGLERMMEVKRKHKGVKCFVSSTKPEYKKLFDQYSNNTYQDLNCKFLEPKSIEKHYDATEVLDFQKFTLQERKTFIIESFL